MTEISFETIFLITALAMDPVIPIVGKQLKLTCTRADAAIYEIKKESDGTTKKSKEYIIAAFDPATDGGDYTCSAKKDANDIGSKVMLTVPSTGE